ncbi:MAG: DUF4115 domain-containing protein [Thermanaerothrix sp.]|nr:DUF4115 domain-containing protein [Thermanaerothrix sp.]
MSDSVGSLLKKARIERNISLEQIAQATHIRLAYLEALENDRLDLLPSKVQARGFLRLYANYLKIPAQPLLDLWEGKNAPPTLITNPSLRPVEAGQASSSELTADTFQLETPPLSTSTPVPNEVEADILPPISSSQQIFHEIGLTLRYQRERLGLTLEEVASATHIRSRHLAAIESGQMDQLPSLVHARGMLQNYAAFLGANEDQILLRFAEALQQRRLERTGNRPRETKTSDKSISSIASHEENLPWRRIISPDLVMGLFFILSLLGFTIWGALRISATQKARTQSTPPAIAEVLAQMPTALAQSPSPPPGTEITAVVPENTEAPAAIEATPANTPMTEISNAPLQLNVVAQLRVWMRVVADGKVVFEGRTIPGQAYAFGARQRIEFSSGNGAGVRLVFNQSDLGNPGAMGEPVRWIFTAEGLVTPTPQFTTSPTITPLPTPTPTPTPLQPTPTITPLIP